MSGSPEWNAWIAANKDSDDFIDRFAIVGTPDHCIQRLQSLAALGLDKVAISGGTRGAVPQDVEASRRLTAEHVLPGMRR